MKLAIGLVLVLLLGLAALGVLLVLDLRADHAEWRRLQALQPSDPVRFDPDMLAGLPEPGSVAQIG